MVTAGLGNISIYIIQRDIKGSVREKGFVLCEMTYIPPVLTSAIILIAQPRVTARYRELMLSADQVTMMDDARFGVKKNYRPKL